MLSKTGRKIRKDSFEAQHDMEQVCECLKKLYVDQQLSTNQIPPKFLKDYGIKITANKCYQLLKRMGMLRNKSESISLACSTLDYNKTHLNERLTGIVEGILIGDGTMNCNERTKVARLSISGCQKEFIQYCYKLLSPYKSSVPSYNKNRGKKNGTGVWTTRTKFHPDLYSIYRKWHNGKKDIPSNLQFTPLMVLLWYLGDGSLSNRQETNSMALYFSTNSFSKTKIKEYLIPNFKKIGVESSRITKDNRIFIKTESIKHLLKYMGGKSPVLCYSYKFDIDPWRLKKTMKETSLELNLKYEKLANWVKTGIVECSRSPGGKKVLFSDKEFNELKRRLDCGQLHREKGKKATRTNSFSNQETVSKKSGENIDEYIERTARFFIQKGFPYKNYTNADKQKKWTRLKASQYIIPKENIIKWRRHGLPLADSFHPHIYELNRKNKISPYTLFHDEIMLQECLKNNRAKDGTLTSPKVLSAICSDSRSLRLNNFSPSLARDVYNYYCEDGYKIIDPCAGFSGRLLGASVSKKDITYTGIDPSVRTYKGLIDTKIFLSQTCPNFKTNIENGCAEELLEQYQDEYFNFCFTSPPYYNVEEYDIAPTQSYVKYKSYEEWVKKFIAKTMFELFRILTPKSFCVINIGKTNKHNIYEDLSVVAKKIGFSFVAQKYISFPLYRFSQYEKKERLEPLMIFQKQ